MISSAALNCTPIRSDNMQGNTRLGFGKHKHDEDKPSISVSNATRQLGKGFISPVKEMVDSPTSIAVTAGVGALTVYVLKKVPQVGPLMVAAGLVLGSIQTVLGLKKAAMSNSVEAKEKGFYEAGQGAFAVAASALTSKSLLADAEAIAIPSKDTSVMQSMKACIKGAPEFFKTAVKKLSKDNFITEAISTLAGKTPKNVGEVAQKVASVQDDTSIIKSAFQKRLFPIAESDEVFKKTTD